MTPLERDEMIVRLYDDVQALKTELAEWRGAIRLVKYGGSLLGIGGISVILAALVNLAR